MNAPAPATPKHLWIVGGLALLWNCIGALDYTMTELRNADYLASVTPEQLAYFESIPAWAIAAWAIGVWGGVAGSVLLLLRRRLAVPAFGASLAAVIVTFVQNYALSDGYRVMGGAGAVAFSATICAIALALLIYARAQAARGVLR